jgi:plastocyanin
MVRLKSVHLFLATALAVPIAACGDDGDDTAGPEPAPVLAPAPTKSGDQQQGVVEEQLASALRVIVTLEGEPAANVPVQWSASGSGVMRPTTSNTNEEGVAESFWTLGSDLGPQTARATVEGATGSPVTFNATATEPELPGPTVQVLSDGNRFDPAAVTINAGESVTWVWPEGSIGHNVTPDNGSVPARSGNPQNGPTTYVYTFATPGVYRYYCQVHGAPNGVGMSGTVTVQPNTPTLQADTP